MTSTHTGNPVCCAAALAGIRKIVSQGLTANAAALEPILLAGLQQLQQRNPAVIGHVTARGLVGGVQFMKWGRKEPDHDLAHNVIERCFHKGLLMFSPVGAWGQTVKIAPPLTIPRAALEEGLAVLAEATAEAIEARYGKIQKDGSPENAVQKEVVA
jgi:4-aminobutyrate aminotransferase-like enzyme